MKYQCKSKSQWNITSHLSEQPGSKKPTKYWQGCGEKETLVHTLLVEILIGVDIGRQISSKIKNRAIIRSSYPTPCYLSREYKDTNLKSYLYPHVHCGIIYNSQDMETA